MHYIWQEWVNPFLNSTFFLSLTTVSVAYAAWFVYRKNKADFKADAANTILLEIENAERLIKEAKKTFAQGQAQTPPIRSFVERSQVMKSDSWAKYRYLFARDLPPAQLNDIDDFYLNCKFFDEAIAYIDSAFSRNEAEVRVQSFRVLADALAESVGSIRPNPRNSTAINARNARYLQKFDDFKQNFTSLFPTTYGYGPTKPYDDAQYYLELLPINLSQLKVGDYLREFSIKKRALKRAR